MKLSKSGLGVTRLQNLDEMFPAQDILLQSGQIYQYTAGIYGYNNIPLQLKQTLENVVKDTLNKYDCIEVSLPTLQPESLWQKSGRLEKYIEDGTMLTVKTEKGNFCLAPTAEEAITEFIKKKIKSYKDLPCTLYQIGEKYRNEIRNRGYLMRGKCFPMMDAYSFNLDENDLVNSYNSIKEAYIKIFETLELEAYPVVADNGAIGGKKSEEFMLLSEAGEDTILLDKVSGKYLNSEILERPDHLEYLKREYGITDVSNLEPKKAIELGHIFQLGTKYSETMGATYIDNTGKEKIMYMGCYGIGITRLLATVYELSILKDSEGKPNGIALPYKFAPYFLQIVVDTKNEEKFNEALNLYSTLINSNVPVILDDRKDTSFGGKIKNCKILGTPFMAVIGNKVENGFVEVENIKTENKTIMTQENLIEKLIKLNTNKMNKNYSEMESLI